MTTENQEVNQDNPGTPEPEIKAQEPTDIEKRAMEMGWRPLTEFNGDEDDFIDAKEFVRRKPLFDKIEHTSKELKAMRKAFEALKTHYTTVNEASMKAALANLQQARKDAVSNSDGDKFDEIDKEIKRVETEVTKIAEVGNIQEPQVVNPPPEFVAWTNRNPWYNSVDYMRTYADKLGPQLYEQGHSPREVLRLIEEAVKKEFPTKFRNPNKDDAPDVDESGKSNRRSSTKDTFQLTAEQERTMNTLIKADPKLFTKEKYIADLKAIHGIK